MSSAATPNRPEPNSSLPEILSGVNTPAPERIRWKGFHFFKPPLAFPTPLTLHGSFLRRAMPDSNLSRRSRAGFAKGADAQQTQVGKVLEFAEYSFSRTKKLAADSGSTLKKQFTPNNDAEPWKGLAAGLIAGFVGTAAMTAFQVAWLKGKSELEKIESDDPSKV